MFKYETILYWSNADEAFVAEVPELADCMAHGETQEDAHKNVNQPMELWIDSATRYPSPRASG